MGKLIYAADDEQDIREVVGMFLRDAGFTVELFDTGDALLAAFRQAPCDLAILDVMMPSTDGIAVCAQLRQLSRVPVILLTARDSETDYARGYHSGGDDYMTKPFRPSVLVMKARALLRRGAAETEEEGALDCAGLHFSRQSMQVTCAGHDLRLTMTELRLLRHLMAHCGSALSRDALLKEVWDFDLHVESRVVDETVRRVRSKMALAGSTARIRAVWGYGYRLEGGEAMP